MKEKSIIRKLIITFTAIAGGVLIFVGLIISFWIYRSDIIQKTETMNKQLNVIADVISDYLNKQDVSYEWEPLKAQDDLEKAQLSGQYSQEVIGAYQAGIITQKAALKELSSLSEKYNVFTNITDEDIDRAKDKTINELQQMQDPMAGLTGDYLEPGQEPSIETSEEQTEDAEVTAKPTQEEAISKLDDTIKELNSNSKSDVIETDNNLNEYNGEATEQVVVRYEQPHINTGLTISNIPIQKTEVVKKKTDYLEEPQKESNLLKAIKSLVNYIKE